MAEVVLTRPAADALRALQPPLDEAALDALTVLESDPWAGSALRGRLRGVWSLRVGAFRLLYTVERDGALVRVRAVRHRSVAYRSDPR
ncbi:MAG: type II toxin-antitoxin system RelE family toxin [Sporichthyaceae bacterium]